MQRQVDNRLVHPLPFPWSHGRGFQAINQKGLWQAVSLETGRCMANWSISRLNTDVSFISCRCTKSLFYTLQHYLLNYLRFLRSWTGRWSTGCLPLALIFLYRKLNPAVAQSERCESTTAHSDDTKYSVLMSIRCHIYGWFKDFGVWLSF